MLLKNIAPPVASLFSQFDGDDPNMVLTQGDNKKKYVFPENLLSKGAVEDRGPYIQFSMYKYERGLTAIKGGGASRVAAVCLPMPSNISQAYGANMDRFEANVFFDASAYQDAGVSGSGTVNTATGLAGAVAAGVAGNVAGSFMRGFSAAKPAVGRLMAGVGDAAAGLRSQISATSGIALNPRLELAFNGMQLRTHEYRFMMIPRNARESNEIQQIHEVLRLAMHPGNAFTADPYATFLEYPYEFTISFWDVDGNAIPGLPYIPDSFLTNLTIVANPNSSQFFEDGSPTSYMMGLSFAEAQTLTRNDLLMMGTTNQPNSQG